MKSRIPCRATGVNAAYYQWKRGHRGKVTYRTRRRAWRQVIRFWRQKHRVEQSLHPYPCRWGPSYPAGRTAPLHWHIGHGPPFPLPCRVIYWWKRLAWWPYCRLRRRIRRMLTRVPGRARYPAPRPHPAAARTGSG